MHESSVYLTKEYVLWGIDDEGRVFRSLDSGKTYQEPKSAARLNQICALGINQMWGTYGEQLSG